MRLERFLAIVGVVASVVLLGGAVATFTVVRRGFSAREAPSAFESVAARALRRWSIPEAAHATRNPVVATDDTLAAARAHWADHCAGCHGSDGAGVTQMGRMYPPVPDMRAAATQTLSDGDLFYIIENGLRLTGMPAWGSPASDKADSWKLVALIRRLPALSADEIHDIERLRPKSAEDKSEDDFLNGAP